MKLFQRSYTCPRCGQSSNQPGGHPDPAECIRELKRRLETNTAQLVDYKSILELQGDTMRSLSAKVELLTQENARLASGLAVYRTASNRAAARGQS